MERLRAFIRDRIYLPRTPELEDAFLEVRQVFTHPNPEYAKKKRLKFYIGATPKQLKNWNHELLDGNPFLVVPRGAKDLVESVFANYRVQIDWIDKRVSLPGITHLKNNVRLRADQEILYRKVIENETCLIRSPTGSGKCLGGSTKVITSDGEILRAKDVEEGHFLMGPDGLPREVTSVTQGRDVLYRVLPKWGTPWTANKEHILVIYHADEGEIEITIEEYLSKEESWKRKAYLFTPRICFNWFGFNNPPYIFSPYFMGVWWTSVLRSNSSIVSNILYAKKHVKVIVDELAPLGLKINDDIRYSPYKGFSNHYVSCSGNKDILSLLRNFRNQLEIPRIYKHAPPEIRCEFLAGVIDVSSRYREDAFFIRKKDRILHEEILFLARSLGFKAYSVPSKKGRHPDIKITGELWRIPSRDFLDIPITTQKRNLFPFRIGEVGKDNYYGFTLSGDGRFLLEDFTVTHNTEIALKATETMLKEAGPVLVMVWETELAQQWIKRASTRYQIPESEIGFIGGGIERYKPITIAMQQTLWKKGRNYTHKFGGVIVDEVQRFAARTYKEVIDIFPSKYRIGISADETRKDGLEFLIYESFGEIAGEVKKERLIVEGKIHEVVQRIVPTGWNFELVLGHERYQWADLPSELKNWNELLARMCTDNARNDLIWRFMAPSIRAKKSLMVITSRTSHAHYWADRIANAGVSVGLMLGGVSNAKEFQRTRDGLLTREVQVAVGTNQKTGQGHDIPQWDRGFILTPLAGNKQQYEQLVGRLRRTCEGKTDAINYYFWDELVYPFHKNIISARYPETFVWTGKEFSKV